MSAGQVGAVGWVVLVALGGCSAHLVRGTHTVGDHRSDYALYVPEGVGTYRVAVLLPADGGSERDLPADRRLQRWADGAHAIVVSVAPPDGGACWWTPHKHARAAFLVDLLQARVLEVYDVDRDRVDLGGWSGGAFEAFGMPFYVDLPFRGALVGVCGADLPRVDSADDFCGDDLSDDPALEVDATVAAALADGRRVYVARTAGDELVEAIDAGAAFWAAHGATVRVVDLGQGGHCDFDVTEALLDGLDQVDEGR